MSSATRPHSAPGVATRQCLALPVFQARWKRISNKAKGFVVILWGICKIVCKEVWVWKGFIAAVVVFAIVATFALTDNLLRGPLAVLGPTYGFLVLNILSKLTDYSLFAATGMAWEKAQWKVRGNGQERLMTFLVLSTGLMGWMKILFRGFGSWKRFRSPPVDAHMNLFYHPRTLSVVRILLWTILQLPAVIFMALVNTTTSYYPIQWTPISGGIGSTTQISSSMIHQGCPFGSQHTLLTFSQIQQFQHPLIQSVWKACNAEVLRSGECDQTGGWDAYDGWSSFMSFYRRTVTVAADRHTMVILNTSDMGEPEIQRIHPADFEPALETMFCSWNNTGALASCTALEVRHQVTDTIAILLQNALVAPQLNTPRDYLHNIFAAPLYHFNPMSSGDRSPDSPQKGLPAENSLNGSLARPVRHLTLEAWTIYAYIAISGPILIVTFAYLVVALRGNVPRTSEFPIIDALILRSRNIDSLVDEQSLVETFDGVAQGDGEDILSRVEGRIITQKERAAEQAGIRLATL